MKMKQLSRVMTAVLLGTVFLMMSVFSSGMSAMAMSDPNGSETGSRSAGSITTWKDLQDALTAGGAVVLTDDVTCDDQTLGPLVVPAGVEVTLDLNGHIINRGRSEFVDEGYVIRVEGDMVLMDSKPETAHNPAFTYVNPTNEEVVTLSGGIITGGYSPKGGGVYVSVTGTLTMNGGSISGNKAGNDVGIGRGGGVYVDGGAFFLKGGQIVGNSVEFMQLAGAGGSGDGGGVYTELYYEASSQEDIVPTFEMSGGSISCNKICILQHMSCTISGGGVRAERFKMSGGTISYNVVEGIAYESLGEPCLDLWANAGGVVAGAFTMIGGNITGNIVIADAVSKEKGVVNTAHVAAGGVLADEFVMTGGTISYNTAKGTNCSGDGGGVYANIFEMSGNAEVIRNCLIVDDFGAGVR